MSDVVEAVIKVLEEGDTDYAVALLKDSLRKESKGEVMDLISKVMVAIRKGDTEDVRAHLEAALNAVSNGSGKHAEEEAEATVEESSAEEEECTGDDCPYEPAPDVTESSEGELITEASAGHLEEAMEGSHVYKATLIEAGMSKNRNFWTSELLQMNAGMFDKVKAFADHPTKTEMHERPERSIRDIIGWYENVRWYPNMMGGSLKGELHLIEGPVADIVQQAHANGKSDLVQLSVNISGRRQPKMVNGIMCRAITELHRVHSVDAVTEASAGGSIDQLVASERESKEVAELMTLENISTEDLLTAIKGRTELEEAVRAEFGKPEGSQESEEEETDVTESDRDEEEAEEEEETTEEVEESPSDEEPEPQDNGDIQRLTEAVETLQRERTIEQSAAMVERHLGDSRLPEPIKKKVRKQLVGKPVQEDVLEAILEEEQETLTALTAGRPPSSVPWAEAETSDSEFDRWGKAMDGMFAGQAVDGVEPFRHIRHAHSVITGADPWESTPYNVLAEAARYDSGDRNRAVGTRRVMEAGPMVTTDFAGILGDSITRRALTEYRFPALQDWRRVASVGSVSDLREQKRERLGEFPLLQRGDGAGASGEETSYPDLTENSLPEEEAKYTPLKAKGMASLTIEMIINDDLGKFRALPRKLGRAAAATIYVTVFDFFILNPLETAYLSQGGTATVRLFDTAAKRSPGNLVNDTETAAQTLNDAMVTDAKKRFRQAQSAQATATYTGARNHSYILAEPKLMLLSPENEASAKRLVMSDNLFTTSFGSTSSRVVEPQANIHKGSFEMAIINYWQGYGNVVTDGNTVDAKDMWFLIADPNDIPMIEVGFLGGREDPEVFVQDIGTPLVGNQWTVDRITYKVRHFWGANPLDHRGMVGSTGG